MDDKLGKILIVDDDENINELIDMYLKSSGYETKKCFNGLDASNIVTNDNIGLVLLDIMIPGKDGVEVLKFIRKQSNVPVIMLTAKGEVFDKVLALELGADDYMVKPFEPKELLFRIAAILRRYDKPSETILRVGSMTINRKSYEVSVGQSILLMPLKEFEVLALLATRPNQVFERADIMEKIWGYDYDGDEQTLNTHIKRIRERLAKFATGVEIVTVRGVGYKLEVQGQ